MVMEVHTYGNTRSPDDRWRLYSLNRENVDHRGFLQKKKGQPDLRFQKLHPLKHDETETFSTGSAFSTNQTCRAASNNEKVPIIWFE